MQTLGSRVPSGGTTDTDEILDLFLEWAGDAGFDLYPAQEEALLELMSGRHVVLSTPTGSGKSLVALGLHFKGLCEGRTSFYTSPIKALASEKFFSLCEVLGPENVGMKTGTPRSTPTRPSSAVPPKFWPIWPCGKENISTCPMSSWTSSTTTPIVTVVGPGRFP